MGSCGEVGDALIMATFGPLLVSFSYVSQVSCPSAALRPHLGCPSAAPRPHFGHTSAASPSRPHLGDVSANSRRPTRHHRAQRGRPRHHDDAAHNRPRGRHGRRAAPAPGASLQVRPLRGGHHAHLGGRHRPVSRPLRANEPQRVSGNKRSVVSSQFLLCPPTVRV